MGHVLVVDDERNFRTVLTQILKTKGHEVSECGSPEEAMQLLEDQSPDLVVSDVRMQPVSGLVFLQNMRAEHPEIPVVMMTAYASVETALDTLKMGAYDYLTKPFKIEDFMEVVERALASTKDMSSSAGMADLVARNSRFDSILCVSSAIRDAFRMVELVAPTDTTVLLTGEKGTGRTAFARAIHRGSMRKDGSCVVLECGQLHASDPVVSFMGELPEPGSGPVTGAGGLLAANGGSLILEDVDQLPAEAQEVLLVAMRDKAVTDPKEGVSTDIDVRILATTTVALDTIVSSGAFSSELFRRIGLMSIELCPLAQRRDDILPLAWSFLRDIAGPEQAPPEMSPDARGALQHYVWPGNVAELREAMQHASAHLIGGLVARESLPPHLLRTMTESISVTSPGAVKSGQAQSLKAFLRKKGVDVDEELQKDA